MTELWDSNRTYEPLSLIPAADGWRAVFANDPHVIGDEEGTFMRVVPLLAFAVRKVTLTHTIDGGIEIEARRKNEVVGYVAYGAVLFSAAPDFFTFLGYLEPGQSPEVYEYDAQSYVAARRKARKEEAEKRAIREAEVRGQIHDLAARLEP